MPKPRELSDTRPCTACPAPGQMHLALERPQPALPEPRDLRQLIKRTLAQDIRESSLSREQIAGRIELLTGKPCALATLDAMVAESKDHRFPAEWVPAWVLATGSRRLLDLLVTESGYWLADATERDLADLARSSIQARKASSRAESLRSKLWDRV